MERVTMMTYPEQREVNEKNRKRGILGGVTGVASFTYNPAGQVLTRSLANGVEVTHNYDSRLRLDALRSVRGTDGLELQNFSYVYDDASHITSIDDHRSTGQLTLIGVDLGLASGAAEKYAAT